MVYQVTTREFRDNQKSFLDLIDKGAHVVIHRSRGKKAYAVTPISDDDLYFTPEMQARIDSAVKEVQKGEVYEMKDEETLNEFLDRVADEVQG
jgi:predicted Fe-Mo cluster-binding NifX family protein